MNVFKVRYCTTYNGSDDKITGEIPSVLTAFSGSLQILRFYAISIKRLQTKVKYEKSSEAAPILFGHLNIENKSTDELAELGYFITRYIERFGFDSAVGTGKNKPNPQVRFVPNRKVDYGHNKRQIV